MNEAAGTNISSDNELRRDLAKRSDLLRLFLKGLLVCFICFLCIDAIYILYKGINETALISMGLLLLTSVMVSGSFLILKKTKSPVVAGNYLICILFILCVIFMYLQRGEFTPTSAWIVALPVIATMLGKKASGFFWMFFVILVFGVFHFLKVVDHNFYPVRIVPPVVLQSISIILLGCFLAFAAYTYEKYNDENMGFIRALTIKDELTGLVNLMGFMMLGDKQLKQAKRDEKKFAIIFIDLDGFKQINDTYGHKEGDEALIEASHILRGAVRETDIVGRLGGDEFAIAANVKQEDEAEYIMERVGEALSKHQVKTAKPYKICLSHGIVFKEPDEDTSLKDLVSQSDHLMYQQKQSKKKGT